MSIFCVHLKTLPVSNSFCVKIQCKLKAASALFYQTSDFVIEVKSQLQFINITDNFTLFCKYKLHTTCRRIVFKSID